MYLKKCKALPITQYVSQTVHLNNILKTVLYNIILYKTYIILYNIYIILFMHVIK